MDKSAFGPAKPPESTPAPAPAPSPDAFASPVADGGLARVSTLWHRLPADVRETIVRIAEVWAEKKA